MAVLRGTCPSILVGPTSPAVFRRASSSRAVSQDRLRVCSNGKGCHSEVVSLETDNAGSVVDKFERSFKRTNVFFESRRRQQFENKQDAIKRRRKEHAFKRRQVFYSTYFDSVQGGLNVPPFSDLFDDGEEDLFSDDNIFSNRREKS